MQICRSNLLFMIFLCHYSLVKHLNAVPNVCTTFTFYNLFCATVVFVSRTREREEQTRPIEKMQNYLQKRSPTSEKTRKSKRKEKLSSKKLCWQLIDAFLILLSFSSIFLIGDCHYYVFLSLLG